MNHQPTDRSMVALLWPCLLAAALGLVPFTIFSTFLVDIAAHAHTDAAFLGGLRGLGGIAALITGILFAPWMDRLPRRIVASGALLILAVASALATLGQSWSWILFCLLIGSGTAILNPATTAAASDSYTDDATAGRAATLVSSTMTLTAMLAAPMLALPATIWGWRGTTIATAVACVLIAWIQYQKSPPGGHSLPTSTAGNAEPADATTNPTRPGYLASFRAALSIQGALPLVGASVARTAAFMGQLAFIAVYYNQAFNLSATVFSLVWSLSGLCFFLGNWFGGKVMRTYNQLPRIALITSAAAVCATASILVLFHAPTLPVALAMTGLTSISHAIIAAGVTTVLVRTAGTKRGMILSLNGAGQALGTFSGAALAGAGLSLAGWAGTATVLAAVTALAAVFSFYAAVALGKATEVTRGGVG